MHVHPCASQREVGMSKTDELRGRPHTYRLSRRTFLISTAATAALAACAPGASPSAGSGASAGNPKSGGTLTIAAWNEPRTLGITNRASDVVAAQVSSNICNTLVRYDLKTQSFVPELAESWEQKDPLTWVFKLRQGVQFHKGYGEMTAEDVAFYVNHIIDNKGATQYYYSFVKNAQVIDKYTVQYNLSQPSTPFLGLSTAGQGGEVQSKKAWQEKGEAAISRDPVGTGPFYVDRWTAGDRIILKKFDKYWRQGRPHLDQIVWRIVPDPIVRENLLKTGEVDFVDVPEFKDLDELKKDPKLTIDNVAGWNWDYMTFDMAKTPFNKQEVRQAISYALDRRALSDAVYYGWGTPTDTMLPGGLAAAGPALMFYPERGDQNKAKQLLASAGFPNGFDAEVITGSKENLRRELQIIVDQLAKVGIRLKITQLDEATYTKRIRGATDFQIEMSDITLVGPDADAPLYLFYHSTGVRNHNHKDPEIDSLLEGGRRLADGPARTKYYQDLAKRLVETAYYIYMANAPKPRVHVAALKGFVAHPMEIIFTFENAWLDR